MQKLKIPKEMVARAHDAIRRLENARKESGLPLRGYFMDHFGKDADIEYAVKKNFPALHAELKNTWSALLEIIRLEFGSSGKWGRFETVYCRFKTDSPSFAKGIYSLKSSRIWAHDRSSRRHYSIVAIVRPVPPAVAGGADLLITDCTKNGEFPEGQYQVRMFEEVVSGLERQLPKYCVASCLPDGYREKQEEKNRTLLDVGNLVKNNLELLK